MIIPDSLRAHTARINWLLLVHTPGLGAHAGNRILERFGNVAKFLAASPEQKRECGLKRPALDYLRAPDWGVIAADIQWLDHGANHLIALDDARYPTLLRDIPDPPLALFVRGDPDCLAVPQLAVVGSRNPTPSGSENAFEFARFLVEAGLVITSGLAAGIDGAAHRGALAGGGQTIAVVGTGLDRVYPAEHLELAHAIAAQGALVSEFPLGSRPMPGHFPRRNRLISGLSLGTLVVEATPHSGSLITARLAGEQGRETFAIPGSIHNPQARGCHALIRQGAKLVETASDILEELGPLAHVLTQSTPSTKEEIAPQSVLDPDCLLLLAHLDDTPTSVDILVQRSGLTAEIVSSILLVLELQGYVSSGAGGLYQRAKRV